MSDEEGNEGQNITVRIQRDEDKKGIEGVIGKGILENLKRQCMENNVEWTEPQSWEDVIVLKEAVESAQEAQFEPETSNGDSSDGGAAGQATIQQRSGKPARREFESPKEMIEHLIIASHSPDKDLATEANAILNEFFTKWSRAVRSGEMPHGVNLQEKEGESIVGAYKRLKNEIARKQAQGES